MPEFEQRTVRIRCQMLTAAFITIIVNLGEVKEEGKKKDERKKKPRATK